MLDGDDTPEANYVRPGTYTVTEGDLPVGWFYDGVTGADSDPGQILLGPSMMVLAIKIRGETNSSEDVRRDFQS